MIGVGLKKLGCTPIPKLPSSYPPLLFTPWAAFLAGTGCQVYEKQIKYGWNCSESGLRWKVKLDREWGIYLMLSFPTRSPKPFFELSDKIYICSDVSLLLHQHEQKTCSAKKYLPLALCHIYRSFQKLDLRKLILQRFCGVFINQSLHITASQEFMSLQLSFHDSCKIS